MWRWREKKHSEKNRARWNLLNVTYWMFSDTKIHDEAKEKNKSTQKNNV